MRDESTVEGGGQLAADGAGVLVVSDSDVLRDLLSVILKQRGYRVTVAADSAPAREAVVARQVSSVVIDVRPVAAAGRAFAAWLPSCGMRIRTVVVVDRGEGGDLARNLGAKVLSAQTLERGDGADWTGWLRPNGAGEGRA